MATAVFGRSMQPPEFGIDIREEHLDGFLATQIKIKVHVDFDERIDGSK